MTIAGNIDFPLVKLSINEDLAKVDTIGKVFLSKLLSYPDKTFLKYTKYGSFRNISFAETFNSMKSLYIQLNNLGLVHGDRVLFLSENRQQLITATLGCTIAGFTSVPACPGYTNKQIQEIIDSCSPKCIIISDEKQFEKLGNVKNIAVISFDNLFNEVLYYKDVVKKYRNSDIDFEKIIYSVKPDNIAYILYQFDAQGRLEGVKLSHNNILSSVKQVYEKLDMISSNDTALFNTPLNLIEGLFEVHLILYSSGICAIADDNNANAMLENMTEVNASIFSSTPDVWKKLFDNFTRHKKNLKHSLDDTTSEATLKKGICWGIIHNNILEFLKDLNIEIIQFYGVSETSGPYTIFKPDNNEFEPLDNIEIKIEKDSEIYVKGENVFLGYLNNKHPLNNGWFKTGNIGSVTKNGNIKIIGKKNDYITLLSGYRVSPLKIETMIHSQFISQIAVIGDKKEFLSALVVPDIEYLKEYARKELKIEYQTIDELLKNKWIKSLYRIIFENLNSESAHFERIKGFALLSEPFSVESGELTPDRKLVREVINLKRSHEIESVYKSHFTRLLFEASYST